MRRPRCSGFSAADKLYNARAILADFRRIGEAIFARFKGGKDGTLWYYGALVETFTRRGVGFLGEELERVVHELHRVCPGALRRLGAFQGARRPRSDVSCTRGEGTRTGTNSRE